jgi:hypothetical protein
MAKQRFCGRQLPALSGSYPPPRTPPLANRTAHFHSFSTYMFHQ